MFLLIVFTSLLISGSVQALQNETKLQVTFESPDTMFSVLQGKTVPLRCTVNQEIQKATVSVFSKEPSKVVRDKIIELNFFPTKEGSLSYECFVPVAHDMQPGTYSLLVEVFSNSERVRFRKELSVIEYVPKKKKPMRSPADKVKYEKEMGKPQELYQEALEKAIFNSQPKKLWQGTFMVPVQFKKIKQKFGDVWGEKAHEGIDFVDEIGTPIFAPQDGIVVFKDRPFRSGNSVIIDHGCKVVSVYFHLDEVANINVGDKICKGTLIGTLGQTGAWASFKHLHWGLYVHGVPVDPMQWTDPEF